MLEIVTGQIPRPFETELVTVRKYKLFLLSKTHSLIPCKWDYITLKPYA